MGSLHLSETAIEKRLARLHPRVIDLDLKRIERLLAALGHPERALAPVVHIAGTNGKGSVLAYLRAMMEAEGLRVHAYTSPHLMRFNERIVIAGREITDEELTALVDECEAANGEAPITFFEFTTAVAYLAFQRNAADVVLLETGLGGRLDATNVVDAPALTVLTPISMDHEGFLGGDIAGIAAEKAAIMKPGVACVTSAQRPDVMAVIEQTAEAVGARLLRAGRDWSIAADTNGLRFTSARGTRVLPRPNLAGPFQSENAGIAVAAAEALDAVTLTDDAIAAGLTSARWPARLQCISSGPLAARLPAEWELWLDGGHNPAAGEALAAQAEAWSDRPLDAVFGILNTKDATAFLAPLAPYVRRLRAIAIPGEDNSLSAADALAVAQGLGIEGGETPDVETALDDLAGAGGKPARVLICGSLYLAGRILEKSGL